MLSDEKGALQNLKQQWCRLAAKLGLIEAQDTGRCHPFGEVNFAHSEHVMLDSLNDIMRSIVFFQNIYSEQESKTAVSSSNIAEKNLSDFSQHFKEWKDHRKLVMQRSCLNETLESSTNMLTKYNEEMERNKRRKKSSSSSSTINNAPNGVNHENYFVTTIQILKRIIHIMKELSFSPNLPDNASPAAINEMNENLQNQLFRFYEYEEGHIHYYSIANSNFTLDVRLNEDGSLITVALMPEELKQLPAEMKNQLDTINADLYNQLLKGNYDLFEEKLVILFHQTNILQNIPKCIVPSTGTSESITSLAVFNKIESVIWNNIRTEEQKQMAADTENRELYGHGIIEYKCEGISMLFYKSNSTKFEYSAFVGMEEYSGDSLCPVLRFSLPICLPVYIVQQINEHMLSEMPERFICHSISDLNQSTSLLLELERSRVGGIHNIVLSTSGQGYSATYAIKGSKFRLYVEETHLSPRANIFLVSRFPFAKEEQILPVLQVLRKQLRFNDLFQSCFANSSLNEFQPSTMETDEESGMIHVEISIAPPLSIILRLLAPAAHNGLSIIEVELADITEIKVYLYYSNQSKPEQIKEKIYSEEASAQLNEHFHLPSLLVSLLSK